MSKSCALFAGMPAIFGGIPAIHAGIIAGPFVNPSNGHTYSLLSANTWTGAEAEAITHGAHLATVRSQQENDWLLNTFLPFVTEPEGSLLIGFRDLPQNGNFSWTSGEAVTFTNWGAGEPNNIGSEIYTNLLVRNVRDVLPGQWNNINNGSASLPQYGVMEVVPEPAAVGILAIGAGALLFPRKMTRRVR